MFKLLSLDPRNYRDAPTEGIRRVLSHYRGVSLPRDEPLDISDVDSIRMGTTIATNALLERQGERVALLTTKGFRDILVIGNQARPHIFDLSVHKLQNLYDTVVEIDERVTMEEYLENPEKQPIDVDADDALVTVSTGEPVRILKKPDLGVIRTQLEELRQQGFNSLAICFIHSYLFPDHENQVASLARSMGFEVSVSSELQPTVRPAFLFLAPGFIISSIVSHGYTKNRSRWCPAGTHPRQMLTSHPLSAAMSKTLARVSRAA